MKSAASHDDIHSKKRKALRTRYGRWQGKNFLPLSYPQLTKWCISCGVIPPGHDEFFAAEDVENLDLVWVAVRLIPNLGLARYHQLLLSGQTLSNWALDHQKITLYDFLSQFKHQWATHTVYLAVINRLRNQQEKNYEFNHNDTGTSPEAGAET